MKKVLLLLFLFTISTTAFAQLSIGPKLGIGLTKFRYAKLDNTSGNLYINELAHFKSKVTPLIGVVFNIDAGNYFSLRPELLYLQRGYRATHTMVGSPMDEVFRISYLEVPLNVVIAAPLASGKLEVFAGPSLGYGLGGKCRSDVNGDVKIKSAKIPENPAANTWYYNPLHVSLNVGLGYRIKGVVFQLAYNWGLSSLQAHYKNSSLEKDVRKKRIDIKSSSFTFGIIYLFQLKKKD